MRRFTRSFALIAVALMAVFSVQAASAQMMHDVVYIVVETADGADIASGEVCISGEVGFDCQDIPAGTPSGREFQFNGIGDGEHKISAAAAGYDNVLETVTVNESGLVFTLVLPVQAPANLPNTGAGVTAAASDSLATTLGGAAGVLLLGATAAYVSRRPAR